jgi:hypothetical protein
MRELHPERPRPSFEKTVSTLASRTLGWMAGALCCAATAGAQTYLVDTGPAGTSWVGSTALFAAGNPSCSPQPSCSESFQFIAAQFTLTQASTLDEIQLWMGPGSGGSIDVKIRADFNGLPGLNAPPLFSPNSIYSKTFALGNRFTWGWDVFSGYGAVLAAGTYWVTFEPVEDTLFDRALPSGAATPLPKYAYFTEGNPGYFALPASYTIGVRIAGTAFPALAFGTGARTVMQGTVFNLPSSAFDYDFIQGATGSPLTPAYIFVIPAGHVHGRGKLTEDLLSAGAFSYHGTQSRGAAHGVAFRTIRNMDATAKTFRIHAVLHGVVYEGSSGFPSEKHVRAGIYALDTQGFADTVAASGVDAIEYLLRDGDGYDSSDLAALFPGHVLTHAFVSPPSTPGPVSIPMSLDPITLQPGETFTVIFDVLTYADAAAVNFANTLSPAAVPFTDLAGNPVIELVAVGPVAPPTPTASALALESSSIELDAKSECVVTATATTSSGAPVPDAEVLFLVTSGPNAGTTGTATTDLDGEARFTWFGLVRGRDVVQTSIGTVLSDPILVRWLGPPVVRRR